MSKIRLTESQLHKVISESVKKVLNEGKEVNNKSYYEHNFKNGNELQRSMRKHRDRRTA